MSRKYFFFDNSGHIKAPHEESSMRVNVNPIMLIELIESKFEIIGVFFEENKIGFFVREKQ